MKLNFNFLLFLIFVTACAPKLYDDSLLRGKTFKSKKLPLHEGSTLVFNPDYSFSYIGYGQSMLAKYEGPVVLVSFGFWKYDRLNQQLSLKSDSLVVLPCFRRSDPTDTMWIWIDECIEVLSRKTIRFSGDTYYLQ